MNANHNHAWADIDLHVIGCFHTLRTPCTKIWIQLTNNGFTIRPMQHGQQLQKEFECVILRRTSTRARTRLGRVAEANYVISAFCPRRTRKTVRIIVPFVSIDCRSVLGINPEGIKTVSGIFQEYAERLRNECGFTKLDSASCPRPSGRQVLTACMPYKLLYDCKLVDASVTGI